MTVSADEARPAGPNASPVSSARTVYIDSDMVLLAAHQGRRGIELDIQADVAEGIERLSVVADQTVVLVYPLSPNSPRTTDAARLSAVHRPDYVARDLLDAANHILVEELS